MERSDLNKEVFRVLAFDKNFSTNQDDPDKKKVGRPANVEFQIIQKYYKQRNGKNVRNKTPLNETRTNKVTVI